MGVPAAAEGNRPVSQTAPLPGARSSETSSAAATGKAEGGAFVAASAVVTEEETARQPASGTTSSRAGSPTRSPGWSETSTRLSFHDRAETSAP